MAFNDVEIFEQDFIQDGKVVGKLAIFRGGLKSDNPNALIYNAVNKYANGNHYNEFVEMQLDNPWVRVVIFGINKLQFEKFDNKILRNRKIESIII